MKKIYSIGGMTGTSCDGLDLCLSEYKITNTIQSEKIINYKSFPYPKNLKNKVLNLQRGNFSINEFFTTEQEYSYWLANSINQFLKKFNSIKEACIASLHGQTIWHNPPQKNKLGFSLQMLNPNLVAQITKLTVISNFRQPDIVIFGEGAPLVPDYHFFLIKKKLKTKKPAIVQNIGGIANVSLIDPATNIFFGFDTGPGNCLIDESVRILTKNKLDFDKNGSIAKKYFSKINLEKISKLLTHDYFKKSPPKSTGKELFNKDFLAYFNEKNENLVAATTYFTALTIVDAWEKFIYPKFKNIEFAYICGGGAKNSFLVKLINQILKEKKIQITALPIKAIDPQIIESAAFAYFGVKTLLLEKIVLSTNNLKKQNSFPQITPSCNFHKIMKKIL
jgi:anhydro-N-acetylmuramic acid kinase